MIILTLMLVSMAQAAATDPPAFNGSFDVPENKPKGWDTRRWGGSGDFGYDEHGRNGTRGVSISSEKGGDLSWFTHVPVKAYSRYRLSGYIKTENVEVEGGKGALINLHEGPSGASQALAGTNDWTPVSFEFETGRFESIMINCLFGGWGRARGKAWYDDIQLEYLGGAPLEVAANIDAAKTGAPISKYIYGQFIEHLGRCIYGGIWAEMLEDRKFYYPVDDKESPWKSLGGAVEMVTEHAFVGAHTPRVRPGSGIAQSGLGLIKGKRYDGRIVLAGSGTVTVSLVWGAGAHERDTERVRLVARSDDSDRSGTSGPLYKTYPLHFRAGASTDNARIEIIASETTLIGTLSLMPADNVRGMRRDTLALLKQLNSPVYRWPGGNFVSGYDWRDGIGDRDKRPPRKNPAWLGVEHNDFGLHEFMDFCREIHTEPYISVNSGQGGVELARDEVEYVNGSPETPMGKLRAQNGRVAPWHCMFWSVGNEMYGDWQLGHMPLEEYIRKHNAFADAMRGIDPSIKLVAVGDTGRWSEQMLTHCADHMDLLSEHFYCGEKQGLIEHVKQIPAAVKRKADAQRKYWETIPSLSAKKIPIALDEWNYWYGPYEFGELGTRYFLQDALGIAEGLHEITRNSDVFYMANYAQTVNVIGAIKTTKTAAAFETTGLVLKLYRDRFGTHPLEIGGDTGPLDIAAAWNTKHTAITVGVVNPTYSAIPLSLNVSGAHIARGVRMWTITGPDRLAYNQPGQRQRIEIKSMRATLVDEKVLVPALSVCIVEIRASD